MDPARSHALGIKDLWLVDPKKLKLDEETMVMVPVRFETHRT